MTETTSYDQLLPGTPVTVSREVYEMIRAAELRVAEFLEAARKLAECVPNTTEVQRIAAKYLPGAGA